MFLSVKSDRAVAGEHWIDVTPTGSIRDDALGMIAIKVAKIDRPMQTTSRPFSAGAPAFSPDEFESSAGNRV